MARATGFTALGHLCELFDTDHQSCFYRRRWPYTGVEFMGAAYIFYYPFSVGHFSPQPLIKPGGIGMKNNIRVERAIKNITQAELAEQVGVSRQTINTIESNKYVPSTVLALKIARVFSKPMEEIFMLEDGD
jgi:putative transcriptional regulator